MIDPHIHYRLHAGVPALHVPDPLVIFVADKDTVVLTAETGARFSSLATLPTGAGEAGSEASGGSAADLATHCEQCHEIATWQGRPVYAVAVDSDELDRIDGTGDLKRENYRSLYLQISDVELGLLGRAIQIVDWFATSRYCSACGTPTTVQDRESAARCPACGHDQYPRLAPAMIVAVVRERKLLLARAPRFKGAFHSVLAGFVEPGESVEECVRREVFEEAAILVKNVCYFGSQSWPFPHSLMLGFTAEWASGEIEIDPDELEHADWYGAAELPPVPSELSISGRLIRWFRESYE